MLPTMLRPFPEPKMNIGCAHGRITIVTSRNGNGAALAQQRTPDVVPYRAPVAALRRTSKLRSSRTTASVADALAIAASTRPTSSQRRFEGSCAVDIWSGRYCCRYLNFGTHSTPPSRCRACSVRCPDHNLIGKFVPMRQSRSWSCRHLRLRWHRCNRIRTRPRTIKLPTVPRQLDGGVLE